MRATVRLSFGYALLVILATMLDIDVFGGLSGTSLGYCRYVFMIGAYIAIGLLAAHLTPLDSRPRNAYIAGSVATAGILLAVLLPMALPGLSVLPFLGAGMTGVGEAYLTMLWLEQFSRFRMRQVVAGLALANLLASSVLMFIEFFSVAPIVQLVIVCIIPGVSVFLRSRRPAVAVSDELSSTEDDDALESVPLKGRWAFPLLPILLLTAFAVSNEFARRMIPSRMVDFTLLGVVAASLVVLAMAVPRNRRFKVDYLWCLAFPLSIIGLVGLIYDSHIMGTVSALCANAAQVSFVIFVIAALCNAAFRYGLNALHLIGIAQAAVLFSMELIDFLFSMGVFTDQVSSIVDGVLIITIVCISVLFIANENLDFTHKMAMTADWGKDGDSESLVWHCAKTAKAFSLTHREEEVLFYLLKGWSVPAIAERFVVADSTVRSHVKHIYTKLSVHSKQELMAFLSGR